MKVSNLIAATKNLTFSQATFLIENSGLCLNKLSHTSTSILWSVEQNNEITSISNSYKDLISGMADVKACWSK